jgi:response regulator RpfG family c-di-GMP phosphodiesterase
MRMDQQKTKNADSVPLVEEGFERNDEELPLQKSDASPPPPFESLVLGAESFQRNKSILVVDDSRSLRQFVVQGLAEAGYTVFEADDGKSALAFLSTSKVDLVVTDIQMPELDGVALYDAVRSTPKLCSAPFIFMSVKRDAETMRYLKKRGIVGYLTKPFEIEQLLILVEKLFDHHYNLLIKEKENFEKERKLVLGAIISLVQALDARDGYTHSHSEAVGKLVVKMGRVMKLPDHEIDRIGIAGRLHDIGKIGIPDTILLKPGPLTEEEFAQIKRHPSIGARILRPIPNLKDIVPIIEAHHERYDGKGYPFGLVGEEIPLWSRMITVADTYHSLTSTRPYRRAFRHAKALEILRAERGAQLCPFCVDTFFKAL